jgi:Protein-L-isoaspartate(D-aspartate) O-methyltransferase (PCMT)
LRWCYEFEVLDWSEMNNPFLDFSDYAIYNPGTLEMALPVVEAVNIKPGMRVLEIGAGSGKVACLLAKHWNVTVVTLEPWSDGIEIQDRGFFAMPILNKFHEAVLAARRFLNSSAVKVAI